MTGRSSPRPALISPRRRTSMPTNCSTTPVRTSSATGRCCRTSAPICLKRRRRRSRWVRTAAPPRRMLAHPRRCRWPSRRRCRLLRWPRLRRPPFPATRTRHLASLCRTSRCRRSLWRSPYRKLRTLLRSRPMHLCSRRTLLSSRRTLPSSRRTLLSNRRTPVPRKSRQRRRRPRPMRTTSTSSSMASRCSPPRARTCRKSTLRRRWRSAVRRPRPPSTISR